MWTDDEWNRAVEEEEATPDVSPIDDVVTAEPRTRMPVQFTEPPRTRMPVQFTTQPPPPPPRTRVPVPSIPPKPTRPAIPKPTKPAVRPPTVVTPTRPAPAPPAAASPGSFTSVSIESIGRGQKRVPPIVTKAGKRAFEVTYRANQRGGGGSSNCNFKVAPAGFFPSDRVRVRFQAFWDDNFQFESERGMPVGGKLGGLTVGQGGANGGNYKPGAASARLTWALHGGLLGYVYPELRNVAKDPEKTNLPWSVMDQSPAFQAISRVDKGIHVGVVSARGKGGKTSATLLMKKGMWNTIEMFVQLNSIGKYDGILEIRCNGAVMRIDSVRYRYTNIQLTEWHANSFFGGSNHPLTDTKAWFADYQFSKN